MGAISIEVVAMGKNIQEAFRYAVEEAELEYGRDPYNGAINHCDLTKDVSHLKKTMSLDKLHQYMVNNTSKRCVMGYCKEKPILNTNKTKSTVLNFPQKGTRKWQTIYQAIDWQGKVYAEKKSQTECIKEARKFVEKNPNLSLDIVISKKLVDGRTKCASISYKSSKKERLGTYVFVGWAPY